MYSKDLTPRYKTKFDSKFKDNPSDKNLEIDDDLLLSGW